MLQDKRQDLDGEKQKRILQRLVAEVSRSAPDFYYRSTSEVALMINGMIDRGDGLTSDEAALMRRLGQRDIEIMLSLH